MSERAWDCTAVVFICPVFSRNVFRTAVTIAQAICFALRSQYCSGNGAVSASFRIGFCTVQQNPFGRDDRGKTCRISVDNCGTCVPVSILFLHWMRSGAVLEQDSGAWVDHHGGIAGTFCGSAGNYPEQHQYASV